MEINAIFCKKCKEIIYSRARHDFTRCSCDSVGIDGGFDYLKVYFDDVHNFIEIKLNGDKLLEQILCYDFLYGNRDIPEEFKNGWYGKFKLHQNSNPKFYKDLIVDDFNLVWSEI